MPMERLLFYLVSMGLVLLLTAVLQGPTLQRLILQIPPNADRLQEVSGGEVSITSFLTPQTKSAEQRHSAA